MAGKKVYAVKKGRTTGIFKTWDECKASVDGYSGAVYKSFFTEEEANAYLYGTGKDVPAAVSNLCGAEEDMPAAAAEKSGGCFANQVTAYVDGSFNKKIGRYAFGCVLLLPDDRIVRESGNGNNPESLALRNVTGEMLGAMFAVKWCSKHGYPAVEICYDYMGIEMWATGGWSAKNSLTQKYAQFMQENSRKLDISFKKIVAHTGDKYNEEADKLAKAALVEGNGIPEI